MKKVLLGVNVDHVATLREARREGFPDPVVAAAICEQAGADSIVCHLREDRRHIHDADVRRLRKTVKTRLNLEMSLNEGIVRQALKVKPDLVTLVPEKREEVTTEGGLDVIRYARRLRELAAQFVPRGIAVSLFVDPKKEQIRCAQDVGATIIELHTGTYARCRTASARKRELDKLQRMSTFGHQQGLIVSAGHGLDYENTAPVARIPEIVELNIGHSIITRAVFVGLKQAVKDMRKCLK